MNILFEKHMVELFLPHTGHQIEVVTFDDIIEIRCVNCSDVLLELDPLTAQTKQEQKGG